MKKEATYHDIEEAIKNAIVDNNCAEIFSYGHNWIAIIAKELKNNYFDIRIKEKKE